MEIVKRWQLKKFAETCRLLFSFDGRYGELTVHYRN